MSKKMSPKSSPSPSSSSMSQHPFFPTVKVHDDRKEDDSIEHKVRAGSTSSKGPEKRAGSPEQPIGKRVEVVSVSCDGCRPHQYSWESKISVVPLEYDSRGLEKGVPIMIPSPSSMFRMIISSLSRRSPAAVGSQTSRIMEDESWKVALDELSRKLIETMRESDAALLEVSRLKYSMVELDKKLNGLEVYCHSMKSGLEEHRRSSTYPLFQIAHSPGRPSKNSVVNNDKIIGSFSIAESKARKCVRTLTRLIVLELRYAGSKVHGAISGLLRPYNINILPSTNPRSLVLYLDALLNNIFFEDFETIGFHANAANPILNTIELCQANFASYKSLKGMTWPGVLEKGTRHFCDRFSRFCDRKMSDIVSRLGWGRAWPEALLEAFFGASKSVWLVHLLANSVHPGLPIFRVDAGTKFDPVYMEDLGQDKLGDQRSGSANIQLMVSPGFYIQDCVIKCKVFAGSSAM
ncbi:hypothetical protein CDL15_Pgr017755 [Punica granatum]|uniref:GIL1/IRKI C-terminal domain-containing protein n=1 Tax=Punica granatum TaxID=22663 RepID=A0A218WIN3_PUNGR|nr:hypothetical protein CDL15_Pgr017755 [Punica granatum]